jgi:hypothetical protein
MCAELKSELEAQRLIRQITDAFRNVKRPENSGFIHKDCSAGDDEDVSLFYKVRNWETMSSSLIEEGYAAKSFFSPEAFQFFIPAFMIWSIHNLRKSSAFVIDSTIYSLNPYKRNGLDDFSISKYAMLSESQKLAIICFLGFIRDNGKGWADTGAASMALDKFWNAGGECRGRS